jgi:hypothetical protein
MAGDRDGVDREVEILRGQVESTDAALGRLDPSTSSSPVT